MVIYKHLATNKWQGIKRNEVYTMDKKQITVNELIKQLQKAQEMGRGNDLIWFRDWNDIDHEIEQGIYDTYENNIVLG